MDATIAHRIWQALATVPGGRVVTYGQLAGMAGLPAGYARVTGTVLSRLPLSSHLPWHRVINHKGELSFERNSARYLRQRQRLESEGIKFTHDRISLRLYRWHGGV